MEYLKPEMIRRVLEIYDHSWRFLKSASLDDKIYQGLFELKKQCPYLLPSSEGFKHATETELDNCLSQLCYASIADIMSRNQIQGFEDYDFSKLQENGVFTIQSNKRFRRVIPRAEFRGQIELDEIRTDGDLSILHYTGNFKENSMIIDSLRIVLKKPQS